MNSEGIVNNVDSELVAIDETYAINMSLVLDEFNETTLLYDPPYGIIHHATTYASTMLVNGVDGKYITAQIVTPWAALINRRVTSINVWGGKKVGLDWIWRKCANIDINTDWLKSSDFLPLRTIELIIGNEINTGEIYEDCNNRAYNAELVQLVSSFTRINNRSLIVGDTERQNIYYSAIGVNGFETSIIPKGNYILDNQNAGDIWRLTIIGRKLVIFKNTSFSSADVDTFPSLRIITLASDVGLASIKGLVNTGDILAVVTQSDIRVTDGFKCNTINRDWVESYREMDILLRNNCLAWQDPVGKSLYFQFYHITKLPSYALWVCGLDDWQWRREDFRYAKDDIQIGAGEGFVTTDGQTFYTSDGQIFMPAGSGTPVVIPAVFDDILPVYTELQGGCHFIYTTKDELTGRTLLLDDAGKAEDGKARLYQFPRIDTLETNLVMDLQNSPYTPTEYQTYCYFKSNPVESPHANAVYINGGYIRSTINKGLGFFLNVYRGTTRVLRMPIQFGREESVVGTRFALKRFALTTSFNTGVKFTIKEIGIFIKQMLMSGSVRQEL